MQVLDTAYKLIAYHEGLRLQAYWDDEGKVWTIGYGHTGGVKQGDVWTAAQAQNTLVADINTAAVDALAVFGQDTWGNIDPTRQMALIDMSFNLGREKLSKFDTFLGFVRQYDWTSAVADLAHTAWASELPRRFAHDSSILTTGEPLNV